MHPSRRAIFLMLAGLPLALLPAIVHPDFWPAWAIYLGLCVSLTVIDAFGILSPQNFVIDARGPAQMSVGGTDEFVLGITVTDKTPPDRIEVICDIDDHFEPADPQSVKLHSDGRRVEVRVPLTPRRRGTWRIPRVWLRWHGPLELMTMTRTRELDVEVAVVPDVRPVREMALRFFGASSSLFGTKSERFLGDGTEFDSLRKHVAGLDSRSIDWKASARHRRLLSRQYRAERNHSVVLSIDTGHLMREPLDGIPRLDHAIQRALLLGYLCLRTGDHVGIHAFDAQPRKFVPPEGGVRAFSRLQLGAASLDYSTEETNYTLAVVDLATRLKRRSLIVVFSEFVDSVTAELMLDNLGHLARHHVLVFVSLRDPSLERTERAELHGAADLNRAVVAAELGRDRDVVLAKLRRRGVHVVDAYPSEASMALLNQYLKIKRRELV